MTVADELPRQASLNRLRRFDIRPNRELGQNFLIDDNVLRVIEKEAALDPADVVLEVGGGLGVLSEHLAPRVGHVHVVEVDPSLEAALRDALDPLPNATLHLADAVRMDLAALDPAPTKVVANLPYGVAATVLLHCFSAPDRVEEVLERGYLCSFAGNVTYPKNEELQDAARTLPGDRILVETDAPYLTPVPLRGKPNEPANVVHTAEFVAELRGVSYADLEAQIEENARLLLRW